MKRFCALITLLAALSLVVEAQSVVYQGDLSPLNILPTFDKGYLAVYEPEHAISLYGPDGHLAYKATVQAPHATSTTVDNAAPDSDGSLAVSVEYRVEQEELFRGGIAFLDSAGNQTAFIATGSGYRPTQVCFGPDHSIWTIGWRGPEDPPRSAEDYFILRNYGRDGRLVGAYLPRSSFEQDPTRPMIGGWQLRSANGRIGALFFGPSAGPKRDQEWIETDLHGNIVRRLDIPKTTIEGFTNDGSLYARQYSGGYVTFDPATKSWRTIAGHPGRRLLGADGNNLVFLAGDNTLIWWHPQ